MSNNISNGANQYVTALNEKGEIAFVPQGNSMYPFIKNKKQYVVIKKYNGEPLKKYDVIFYSVKGNATLHRILEVTESGYVVCGDGNIQKEFVKQEDIFGVQVGFYKKNKFIESNDKKYLKKVEKWCNHPLYKKMRLKLFHFFNRVR